MKQKKQIHSLPLVSLDSGRKSILEYFENSWALTELLFSSLKNEQAFYVHPYHKLRHPMIFYYTHPVCFYVNKMLVAGLIDKPVNKDLESLFEAGVDEMNWDDLHEGGQDIWPPLEEIKKYRETVYNLVKKVIKTHPSLDKKITMDSPAWALVMGFEHERIHLETSSVLIRELPLKHLKKPNAWPDYKSQPKKQKHQPSKNPLISIEETTVTLGKPKNWPSFGWDNEYGNQTRKCDSFGASKYLISNGEFYEFVKSCNYIKEKYWTTDGWNWRKFCNAKWPTFWVQDGPAGSHRYKLRTMFEIVDMQWSWPAIVNFHEAKAYCAWKTEKDKTKIPYRLLTEKEHLAIREQSESTQDHAINDNNPHNINLKFGSECAVDGAKANSKGFVDTFGNLWQWCEDHFHPLTNFSAHDYYSDFSTPCFDGRHQMILGGSFISTGNEASIFSRFHFRPHFFQHAGFRIAQFKDKNKKLDAIKLDISSNNKYESSDLINQYMLFHWGKDEDQIDPEIAKNFSYPKIKSFVLQTVELMNQFSDNKNNALDLGCAVGRASFELTKYFNSVTGIDYSQSFVDTANELKEKGELNYLKHECGKSYTKMKALVDPSLDKQKLNFIQADACSLPETIKSFDAVLLANLLCRLKDPKDCLKRLSGKNALVKKNGIVVIASPNSWKEGYTEKNHWLDAENTSEATKKLKKALPGFELLYEEDVPCLIREHRRKYEFIISHTTIWKRNK